MKFIYAFQLTLLLAFTPIVFVGNQIFAQDDFDLGSEEWPDDIGSESSTPQETTKPANTTSTNSATSSSTNTTSSSSSTSSSYSGSSSSSPSSSSSSSSSSYSGSSYSSGNDESTSSDESAYGSESSSSSSSTTTSTTSSYQPVTAAVKKAGPPLMLISRPVYAPYSTETKTMYISAIAEAYFHFKLGALPGIEVISSEKVANNIQNFRDFTRRISRTSYIESARKLGATYLFYQEYEPQGKSVKFELELYSVADNKKLYSGSQTLSLSDFETGLYNCVNEVSVTVVEKIPSDIQKLLAENIFGTKTIEQLGDQIVSEGEYSQKRAEAAVAGYEKFATQKSPLAKYVAAAAFSRARNYTKATKYQNELISQFGSSYPALYLQLASYYRRGEQFNDALDAAEHAKRTAYLELPASIEIARISEAKGDLKRAQSEYLSVLKKGGEDGEVYFQLALVSIGLNNLSQADNYISQATQAGRELDRGDYYNLGLRYAELGSANDKAIESFKNSLGIQQDNEDAWMQLAELYTKMKRDADAAECYVSLFQINNAVYKDNLLKAGLLYESQSMTDKAKAAYDLFLARKFSNPEVSIRLAKIEQQNGNCQRAVQLVQTLDTTSSFGYDIKDIFQKCNYKVRIAVRNEDAKNNRWFGKFIWRALSTVVTLGGAGLGYYFDTQVSQKYDTYNSWQTSTPKPESQNVDQVTQLHNELVDLQNFRNYCYLGAGVGAASLSLSIALPIIVSKK